ncbi:MAG: 1-deoxy-D-xylulose-5-phosphate synthase, partial [Alphaproteobacteria bacterium]|nr:1-deoxy-D-xylulose-5-phosphate synthase [Alphaproteobacteria bacterium]
MPDTPLLDLVHEPQDLKLLSIKEIKQVCDELRAETIDAVSVTGDHLGAGLGVVELTVALHYVFNTPHDRLIWDVGHQAYPHKILTGRRDRIRTLRQPGGLYGFTKRSESEFDPFGTAHSSTSISAGLGMAVARELRGEKRNVISVIGDGAMSGGMAYEAMNNAGSMDARLIVILNDNKMSIAPAVGALNAYLSRLLSSHTYRSLREIAKHFSKKLPRPVGEVARKAEEYGRGMVTGGTLFEELGFFYVGPVDGHNVDHLIPILNNVKDDETPGPVLIHVVTEKGKGYEPAESSSDKYHGVAKFNVVTGEQKRGASKAPSYTNVFADALIKEAERDEDIVAITAAMPSGTGIDKFAEAYPERAFDVGIAEQDELGLATGLAMQGMIPLIQAWAPFTPLRNFDQLRTYLCRHDCNAKIIGWALGLVNNSHGTTHHDLESIALYRVVPNLTVLTAFDDDQFRLAFDAAMSVDGPVVLLGQPEHYAPGADGLEKIALPPQDEFVIGRNQWARRGADFSLVTYGRALGYAWAAADRLEAEGIGAGLINVTSIKPFDEGIIEEAAGAARALLVVEEQSVLGGIGSAVAEIIAERGLE